MNHLARRSTAGLPVRGPAPSAMRRGAGIVVALGGAIAMGSCSRGDADGGAMTIDTVAGVMHIRHSGDAAPWSLRELASIGTADGPASFGRVRSVVADRDGNVYVADAQASEIRVFGPDGSHLRSFGRKGAGPGEFTELYSIAWLGDTLAALDPRAGRISLLTRTGDWVGQMPHAPITGPDIRLHSVGREIYSFDVRPGPDNRTVRAYLRYTSRTDDREQAGAAGGSGARIDTLPWPEQRPTGAGGTLLCRPQGGGLTFFTNPYIAQPFQSPAPGGHVALASSADYRIEIVGTTGDTAMVIEKAHAPAPIADAEWEEVIRPHREWSAKAPGTKCEPVEFTRPAAKPALRTIFFDDDERMWVEVVAADGHRFDVFDARGAHLGTMRAPARQRSVPPYVRDDRLYLVATDSLDVQSVKVYGIER